MSANEPLVLALPKGRILKEMSPLLDHVGIKPEDAFFDPNARQLQFATNDPGLSIIRVRSFDTATFLAFGAAHLAVSGSDVLMEFDHPEIYAPVDLGIGKCRLVVAAPAELAERGSPLVLCGQLSASLEKLRVHAVLPCIGAVAGFELVMLLHHEVPSAWSQCAHLRPCDGFSDDVIRWPR